MRVLRSRLRIAHRALATAVIAALSCVTSPGIGSASAAATCSPAWTIVKSPRTSGGRLDAVAPVSASDVWAVGTRPSYSGPGKTLIEHWDGMHWKVVPSPSTGRLVGAAAVSATDVWAVGLDGTLDRLIEHWDGISWSVVSSPSLGGPASSLDGLAPFSASDIWTVGFDSSNRSAAEHWNGTAWTRSTVPQEGTGDNLFSAAALSPSNVWAVGAYTNPSLGGDQTMIVHWDGTNWSIVSSPSGGSDDVLYDVSAASATDIWTVGIENRNSSNGTLALHWDGNAWSVVPTPGTGVLAGVAAVSGGDVWATGSNGLAEHWDGVGWTIIPTAMTGQLGRIGNISPADLWTVGYGPVIGHLCPVQVLDAGFSPTSASVAQGATATWHFGSANSQSHSVGDNSGLGLFDSGLRGHGSSFTFTFDAAGLYSVIDTGTSHTAKMNVPTIARPPNGTLSTVFTIQWSAAAPPSGYRFDVQIKRPGSTTFVNWMTDQTARSATFSPDTGVGAYSFRARFRNSGTGQQTGWSSKTSIRVTP